MLAHFVRHNKREGKKGAGDFVPVFDLACLWSKANAWAERVITHAPQNPTAKVRLPWVREDATSHPCLRWGAGCTPVTQPIKNNILYGPDEKENLVFRVAKQVLPCSLHQGSEKTNRGELPMMMCSVVLLNQRKYNKTRLLSGCGGGTWTHDL